MDKGGRPTKYHEGMSDEVDKYLAECKVSWDEFHKTRGEKSDTYERIINIDLPMVEGFSAYININKDTLYAWAKKYPIFSDALGRIKQQQHNMLVKGGIEGYFSPVITKLMLTNNHGMREKTDVTTGGEKLPAPILGNVRKHNSDEKDSSTE